MLRWCVAAFALAAATIGAARVAELTPEQRVMVDRQNALENAVRSRFGDGEFNRIRDMYGSIIVAEERRGRPAVPRVLIKDEYGWQERTAREIRAVPKPVAHELDRLMIDADLWAEQPYVANARCAAPRVFVLRHAGNGAYGRLCGATGLAGRAARIATQLRVPAGEGLTTAPPPRLHEARAGVGVLEDMTSHVGNRAREMSYAWERRSLAGAVDPYAEDVVVEFADGRVVRGRRALIDWMRSQQDWSVPGLATQGRTIGLRYERGAIKPPINGLIHEQRELRWEANGRSLRRTYSAYWRYNEGIWQIVHERVSADKLVTDARIAW